MPLITTAHHRILKKTKLLPQATTALAIAMALAALPALSTRADAAPSRTLQLSATGEVTAVPDLAIVTLGMESQAKTAKEALAANTRAMRRVFDLLKGKWKVAERDMATSRFSISPVYVTQKMPDGTRRQRLDGYRVTNMLTIRVRRLETLGDILDSVVSAGSNRIEGITFTFSDPARLKEEALKKAMQNAVKKAKIMAREGDFTLGPVISVHERGSGPVMPAFIQHRTMAKAAAVPVARGEGKVAVTVSVTWEIR